jgi:hypothetical protein
MAKTVEHETNSFCWRRGFKAQDLGQHPCADDIVLLSSIKTDLGPYITNIDHAKINGLWGMVYTKKFPLKNNHLRDLEDITKRAKQALDRQEKQKSRIKNLRQKV